MGLFDIFKSKPSVDPGVQELLSKVFNEVFPGGNADVTRHARAIRAIFNNKLTQQECEGFVKGSKTLIYIADDKTPDRIIPSLMNRAHGKVTKDEIYQAYVYLSDGGVSYSGGDGLSRENPVIITAATTLMGVPAEYAYVGKHFEEKDEDWKMGPRFLLKADGHGRQLEAFALELADGKKITVYFDITSFFGKH